MPVNSTHPDYDFALPNWLRARDVLAGEDAVKAAGEMNSRNSRFTTSAVRNLPSD